MYGRGHEQGTRQVKAATPTFDAIQAAHLARIEAAWTPPTPVVTTSMPAYARYSAAFVQARAAEQAVQAERLARYVAAWDAKPAGQK